MRMWLKFVRARIGLGRPKDSIRFFTQPLVPTVNEKGEWCLHVFKTAFKAGWAWCNLELARDEGIFAWFEKQVFFLVRQINLSLQGFLTTSFGVYWHWM